MKQFHVLRMFANNMKFKKIFSFVEKIKLEFKVRRLQTLDDIIMEYGPPDIVFPSNLDFANETDNEKLLEILNKHNNVHRLCESEYSRLPATKAVYNWYSKFKSSCIIVDEQEDGRILISLMHWPEN